MVGMGWLESALELYEKSGDLNNAKRVRIRISELARDAHDHKSQVSTSIDIDIDKMKKFFDAVSGESIEQGLTLIASKFCTSVEDIQKNISILKK